MDDGAKCGISRMKQKKKETGEWLVQNESKIDILPKFEIWYAGACVGDF